MVPRAASSFLMRRWASLGGNFFPVRGRAGSGLGGTLRGSWYLALIRIRTLSTARSSMFVVDQLILVGSILVLFGIASSKLSTRLGLPVLVLFLAVGLLAGSDGIGGIEFESYTLAHGIGTLALAMILLDGGLGTTYSAFRSVIKPAGVMATLGVLLTATITGVAASWILDLPILYGLLIGSIVGSTDAAAVFAVLRGRGVNLREHLKSLLEVESGANDPMAIFLTIGLLQVLLGEMPLGPQLLQLFVIQMSVGALVGVFGGKAAAWTVNRVNLDASGLYPVLTAAMGLFIFGLAAALGGSGFLAIYLAGLVIGNSPIVFDRGIKLFHDGAAWLSQITMFVLLGLLAFPSRLVQIAPQALLVAAVLIFVSRPVTTILLLAPFRYRIREVVFVSWVGLKGAVPVVLATFPLLVGLDGADTIFDIVFFVTLVSAVLQGWTMPPLARALGLQLPPRPEAPVTLEITSLRDVDGDIVEYTVTPDTHAVNGRIADLAFPPDAVVAMIVRDQEIIAPRGSTRIEPADHVFVVMRPEARPLVDDLFRRDGEPSGEVPREVTRTEPGSGRP